MLSTFSRTVPSRVYEAWIFFIRFLVICINTVIRKESYFRINVCWDIINVQRKQQGTKDSALWDTRQNRGPNPILHRLQQLAVVCSTKKESIHFSVFPPMPQPNSLLLRSSCGGVLNAFSKSKMNVSTCPPLSKILAQSFITVVSWVSQLCLFLNACCLSERSLYSSRWAMMFEHTMYSSNLQGTQVSEKGQ